MRFTVKNYRHNGRTLTAEFVDVLALSPPALEHFRQEWLGLHRKTFRAAREQQDLPQEDPPDDETAVARLHRFVHWASNTKRFSRFNRVVLYRDDGQLVGCVCAYAEVRQLAATKIELIRVSATAIPKYRGAGFVTHGYQRLALDYAKRNLFTRYPRFYTGLCMTPVTYYFASRRSRYILPSPAPSSDPSMEAIYAELYDGQDVIREEVGALEDPSTHAWLRSSSNAFIRYFLSRNPRFDEGYGMYVLVRVKVRDLVYALGTSALISLRRLARRSRRPPQ